MKITQRNVIDAWGQKFPSVMRWLEKLQVKEKSALEFYTFCRWAKLTPPQLLDLKSDPRSREAEKLLDSFVADAGFPDWKKFNVSIAVRSFFKHNYADLAKAAGVTGYEKVKPYWTPSREDLRKLYIFCTNPRDRSILTLLCSTGIAKETLSKLKWKHFEQGWERQEIPHISLPPALIKGHGRGKYKGVRQETFLTPEAKEHLIMYKKWMESRMERMFKDDDNAYMTLREPFVPLSYKGIGRLFMDLSENSGIRFSPHDARRWVETKLEECRIPPNWARKIRGRKVRGEESPYSQPSIEKLREFYKEAASSLEFTTERERLEERVRALEEFKAKLTPEQRELAKRAGVRLRRKNKKKTATNGGWGGQKVTTEAELGRYLQQGWRVVAALPSGNVVIER